MYNPEHSPFKFLNPYGRSDKEIYFGRAEEVEELFGLVKKARIVVVYGPSGSGKTSLVQCGLANRFDHTDWLPCFIYRGQNINHALSAALLEKLPPEEDAKALQQANPCALLEVVTTHYLRPVYLIFDQFEELLLSGNEEETKAFVGHIKSLLQAKRRLPSRLIFVIREEYLGRLRLFEKEIPGFLNGRMRIDPMGWGQVEEVIEKSCARFNITLEQGHETTEKIITMLSPDESPVLLPYLQVYLDQLWRVDFKRDYSNGYQGPDPFPPLVFTNQEIREFGDIRQVLQRFLKERTESIEQKLQEAIPEAKDGLVAQMLNAFVTEHGTKHPVPFSRIGNAVNFESGAPPQLQHLDPLQAAFCVDQLIGSRILREDHNQLELAHDTLAALIDKQRTQHQRDMLEYRKDILVNYSLYASQPVVDNYLPLNKALRYKNLVLEMELSPEQQRYFDVSLAYGRKQKLQQQQSRQRKKWVGWSAALTIAGVLLLIFWYRRVADNEYALVYMGYDIETLTEKEKGHAPLIARYVYDYVKGNMASSDLKRLEAKFSSQFHLPVVQDSFSRFATRIATTSLLREDCNLSEDGRFVVFKNDSSVAVTDVFLQAHRLTANTPDTTRIGIIDLNQPKPTIYSYRDTSILYSYFIDSETVLLAQHNPRLTGGVLPQYALYPNQYVLLNCRRLIAEPDYRPETFAVGGGFLEPRERVFSKRLKSEYDNYRVRHTASGNLIVPYLKFSGDRLQRQVRLLRQRRVLFDTPASLSTSLSKDSTAFITGRFQGKTPILSIRNQDGRLRFSLPGIYFADFSENGNVIFIDKGNLVVCDSNGKRQRNVFVDGAISYAYSSDGQTAIARTRGDSVLYLVDMTSRRNPERFEGLLAGINHKEKYFVLLRPAQTLGGEKAVHFCRIRFDGEEMCDTLFSEVVHDLRFNGKTGNLLLLAGTNHLYLLDKNFKIKAGFQLTANDIWGFSPNGSRFYYVLDNRLCFFDNNDKLVNLLRFPDAYQWLDRSQKPTAKALRVWAGEKRPQFPGSWLWWGK